MEEASSFNHWGKSSEEILNEHFPLHRCCRDGDVEQLSLLIQDSRHNIFTEDSFYGWTPAHWAAYFGKLRCLVKLCESGLQSDVSTIRFNQTPMHIGAFGGHGHCVKWLLHQGGDCNRQDYLGETPVHKAARTGSMECVSLLASHGALLSIKNKTNHTASDLAKDRGFLECSRYLGLAQQRQEQQDLALKQNYEENIPSGAYSSFMERGHDEMEMEECCPAAGGVVPPGGVATSEGDVLLYNGVGNNCVPIAGRKRGREEQEEVTIKRIRTGGDIECSACTNPPAFLKGLIPGASMRNNDDALDASASGSDTPQDLSTSPSASVLAMSIEPLKHPEGSPCYKCPRNRKKRFIFVV